MSVNAPIKTVSDGLVLHFDMHNPRSFVGPPTTNLVPTPNTMAGWGNYSNGTGTPIDGMELGTSGLGYYNAGSWNGIVRSVTLGGTGKHIFSAWQKYLGGHANQTGGSVYISSWGGGDSAVYLDKSILGKWQRVQINLNCSSTTPTFYMISWGGTNNSDHSSFEMCMPQVEADTVGVATPYVNGTRSNTGVLLDTTGNNIITANSLSYGFTPVEFYFNSSTPNYISLPSDIGYTSNVSICAWIKTTGNGKGGYHIVCGPTGLEISIPDSGALRVGAETSGGRIASNVGSGFNDGNWHYISVCWNFVGGYTDVWKDATYVAAVAGFSGLSLIPTVANRSIGIFGVGDTSYGMNGRIGSYSVYDRVLTDKEVRQNFDATRSSYNV